MDEYREGTVAIELFDVASAYHVDIKYNVLAGFELTLYLCFQGAIEAVGVYLFVFEELACSDALAKLLGAEEEVLYAMLLGTTWT